MSAVENLILLYAGIVFLNTALSAGLWAKHRTSLHRAGFYVWAATLLGLVTQGVLSQNDLLIVIGFSFVFLINLALANLIANVVQIAVSWRRYWFGMALGYAGTVALSFAGAGFTVVALPVVLAVAYPLTSVTLRALTRWKSLTFSGRALCVSCLCFVAHNLDFAFLRNMPEMAAFGFTIAILIVFALSIFAPAVVLEVMTQQEARVSAEMEVAHRIQLEILPKSPELPGLEIACYMKPAEKVGGDYYDIYSFGEYSWIMLGDVTGHGLSAGLVMLMAQSIISSILHTRRDITPKELNYLANKILFKNLRRLNEDRSMTIVSLCRVNNENRFVLSGSHDNIYIYRAATGMVEVVDVAHFPGGLGFLDELETDSFSEGGFRLGKDDLLFVGTDGITEAARQGDYRRGVFEETRLVQLIKENAREPLERLKRRVIDELDTFTGGVYHDDVTFVIVRAST